ncbi:MULTISPECIES: SGNH/GDSL hydrolase family protein [Cyanophyceae]|uniref:SGNH/GDSL hydrolase family protein n=1 Tax=Leptolyngbya subtilissima DQ-A4 TaxID=2933933 RepID=A0ABV0JYC3_9CYAN|nr:SGNH/GDSL hydrolase family protein [Nodosilinea sp. FACHB-141]MBD2112108.1 SGNH/GDSL hydrolase family protein [Nodosilinea sp. FACHB-141]
MYSSYQYKRKKPRRRLRLALFLLLLIGIPVGIELLTRLVAHATGTSDRFTANPASDVIDSYHLRFVSRNGQPYAGLPSDGKLNALRDPLLGYRLAGNQQSNFWQINDSGFRDEEAVPSAKAAGEIRIFVLGGSTAFGQLSSNNQTTFASKLETRLNDQVAQQRANPGQFQPSALPFRADQVQKALALPPRIRDGQYRVVNAAVPGYASGNALAMLTQRVAAYNPDFVVVMGGYADLMLPSADRGSDVPGLEQYLTGESQSFGAQLSKQTRAWFDQLYVVQGIKRYGMQRQQAEPRLAEPLNLYSPTLDATLSDRLPADQAELEQRIDRYGRHMRQMVSWAAANKKRLIIAIEPEISSRKPESLTPEESAILGELDNVYLEQMRAGFAGLAAVANQAKTQSANAQVLNFYPLYEDFAGQAFQSPAGLTDEAYTLISDRLYEAIANQVALQPEPYGL